MNLREPRADIDLETDAQIALLPRDARCKGMFFLDVIAQARSVDPSADLHRLAGLKPRGYLSVLDYPHADWMRLAASAASVVNHGRRPAEGMRALGRRAFDTIFLTPLGMVLFGPIGFDLEQVLGHAGTAYRLGLSFGSVTSEVLAPGSVRIEFRNLPSYLETFNVGVVEGAAQHYGVTPTVRVDVEGYSRMTLEVTWR